MSLPEESVAVNTLPEVTTIPTGKKLIFTDPDTNEGGIITLENLTKQILQNLTTQTFGLDQGNLTLLQAINQLNSNNIKYKDITVNDFSIGNQMISGTDKGYFSRVGSIKDYIPDYKAAISATIVSFGDCEGMVTAVFYITQSEPAIYLLSNTKSTIANCVIRIAYIK
jgi:hypothetical protein